jgi:hypothetical protein
MREIAEQYAKQFIGSKRPLGQLTDFPPLGVIQTSQ